MLSRRRLLAALAVLAVAAVALGAVAISDPGGEDSAREGPGRPPVVVLILDEFPTDTLLGPEGQIDSARFPHFARLAELSTWFPNAHTVYDSTFKAVPAILDARLPRPKAGTDFRSHWGNVFRLFHDHGYGIVKVESATAICQPRVCPGTRTKRPGVLARLAGGGRPARLRRWIAAIRPRSRPTLYLEHALLPHEPWIYLPSGRQSRPAGEDPVADLTHDIGFDDPDLTLHNRQRQLLQIGYVDHMLGRLLAQLRRRGMLDEALLVVTADHGYSWDVGEISRRYVSTTNVEEIAPVPLFVKSPHQREGGVDSAYVRNIDVVPTIADLLDVSIDWVHDGESAFSAAARGRDTVRLIDRDFKGDVTIGAEDMERRRAELRVRQAELFRTGAVSKRAFGDPWASVYRVGPHPELLGRGVTAIPVLTATGGTRAVTANSELTRRVRPRSELIPTRLTGALHGGPRPVGAARDPVAAPGAQPPASGLRDVAAAVNGRIVATGRTFRLRGRPIEYFSLMLPETALRAGRNRVELFEVLAGGGLRRLPAVPGGARVGPREEVEPTRRPRAERPRHKRRAESRPAAAQGTR